MKLVKVAGDFVYTDELFVVLSGQLTMQLRSEEVILGVRGCPRCRSTP